VPVRDQPTGDQGDRQRRLALVGRPAEQTVEANGTDGAQHRGGVAVRQRAVDGIPSSVAIVWFERACSANSALPFVHAFLASAYALKGETEHATAELTEARRLGGKGSYSSIARITGGLAAEPKIYGLVETTYFAGRHKAGIPEE
jgi:hypothetical protein